MWTLKPALTAYIDDVISMSCVFDQPGFGLIEIAHRSREGL